jgi:ribose transport system ATP-binding protein
MIHQELNLVDELSVAANLFLGRELRRWRNCSTTGGWKKPLGELLAELDCDFDVRMPAGNCALAISS